MSAPQIPAAMQELAKKFKEHNAVPWQKNTAANPFWKHRGRVEVRLNDGATKFVEMPWTMKRASHAVTDWRPTGLSAEDIKKFSAAFTKGTQKNMPTQFRHLIKTEWFRTFTWRERFALLFGANFVVMIGIATQQNPGETQPVVVGQVSKHTSPDGHLREVIENSLIDANSPVHQMIPMDPNKKG